MNVRRSAFRRLRHSVSSLQALWAARKLPAPVRNARTMLMIAELNELYELGRGHFLNTGAVVDAGCFMGGSTLALGHGILANPRWRAHRRDGVLHSYDRFEIEDWTRGEYFPVEAKAGDSFEHEYRRNIQSIQDLVQVHAGDILAHPWTEGPIEILFIDVAKHWTVSDFLVRSFFPSLVPGHSIVIQQDYLYGSWNGWLPVTMEYLSDCFEKIGDTGTNSVLFRCLKPIPASLLERPLFASLTRTEIFTLFDAVLGRYTGYQRELLEDSRRHLRRILEEREPGWP